MVSRTKTNCVLWLLIAATALSLHTAIPASTARADGAAKRDGGTSWEIEPDWSVPDVEQVRMRLFDYLESALISPERQLAVRAEWKSTESLGTSSEQTLDRLALCLAKADDRVSEIVAATSTASQRGVLPEYPWLADSTTPLLVRNNMRLYLARWLVQEGYYDEALGWLDGLGTADVVAPDVLLFYRAIAHHCLVQPDEADKALSRLQQHAEILPVRFQRLAALMQHDLAGLEGESLDHIARRMVDVRRRLNKGRSGSRVQEVENGVIESLDKMIQDIENQLHQQQQQAMASSSGGQQSISPMDDSQLPSGAKAPGKVDRRDIGSKDGWGNLPEKDREKALQDIGRDFPSHYREVIEEYFRRLAAEGADETN